MTLKHVSRRKFFKILKKNFPKFWGRIWTSHPNFFKFEICDPNAYEYEMRRFPERFVPENSWKTFKIKCSEMPRWTFWGGKSEQITKVKVLSKRSPIEFLLSWDAFQNPKGDMKIQFRNLQILSLCRELFQYCSDPP